MTVQRVRRAVLALAAAVAGVLLTFASAAPATGHAVLLGTDPADGDVLPAPPGLVTLTFDEAVRADEGGVRLLDATGQVLPAPVSSVDGTVELTVPHDLADGSYVVDWSVVSADGHPVGGAFTFAVGEPSAEAPVAAATSGPSLVEVLHQGGRSLTYVGILGAAGLVLFRVLLLDPAAAPARGPALRLAALLAGVALLGLLLHFAAGGAWRAGAGAAGLVDLDLLWHSLVSTPVGLATAVAVVGLLLALGPGDSPAGRAVACGGAVLALLSLPLTGHSRSFAPAWLVLGSDALHVVAGALWFGGVLGLALTLRRAVPAGAVARTVVRFSTTAAWFVLALAVTGTLLAWRILPGVSALTSTGYGRTLIAKIGVVAVVVGIAGWNRFRLVPRAGEEEAVARTRLRRTVGAEAGLILVALVCTGVLVDQSPTAADEPRAAARPVVEQVVLGEATADVRVSPGSAGRSTVEVGLRDAAGEPLEPEGAPQVRLSLPSAGVGPLTPAVTQTGPGRWEAEVDLPFAGEWELELGVRTTTFENPVARVPVPVGP